MRLLAPAKLNLGLRIVGRRPDGYHELESVFLPIDLADELELEVERDREAAVSLELSGGGAEVPADARNLAVRAAQAFLAEAGLCAQLRIALAKRIPAAAGLGGGSSDAGAVLRALAERFPRALDAAALAALALRLGADVPWFLDPRPALVSGVGERRAPLPGRLPALSLVLANPGEPVATARVFAAHAAAATPHSPRGCLARELADALAAPAHSVAAALAACTRNDLESAAQAVCPALAPLRAALGETAPLALGLSGSGGTLYAVFADPGSAQRALERLRLAPPAWARLARGAEAG